MSKIKIAIVTSRYPSEVNHYAHTFVHRRSKFFIEQGSDVTVYVPSKKAHSYCFEGVKVICDHAKIIGNIVCENDIVYFHLLNLYPFSSLNGLYVYQRVIRERKSCAFYIHGSEVQGMSSRNFDFEYTPREFLRIAYKDFYFMPRMREIVRALFLMGASFIAPSKWMMFEAREQLKIDNLPVSIIPNGIDTELFSPLEQPANNTKILCIRPLNSNKYAVDIAIQTMKYLPYEFTLDIYGRGKKLSHYKRLVIELGLSNRVNFFDEFVANSSMPSLINRYSYFMSPTRMDAQGVTMCEAMSCGSIVVSSSNTAIPEFVENRVNGLLGDEPSKLASSILAVHGDKKMYEQLRKEARSRMKKIDNSIVLKQELTLLAGMIK